MRDRLVSEMSVWLLATLLLGFGQIRPIMTSYLDRNLMAIQTSRLIFGEDIHANDIELNAQKFELNDWPKRRLLGSMYFYSNRIAEALSLAETIPEFEECPDILTCFWQGQVFYLAGQTDKAFVVWQNIPQIDVYFALQGDYAYLYGKRDKAIQSYKLSWELLPTISWTKHDMFLHFCLDKRELGLVEEAVQWCERANESQKDYWTMLELGRTYYEAGQLNLAETILNEAISMLPDQSSAYQWLGVTLYRKGLIDEGIDAITISIRLNPVNYWSRLELANIYLEQKDFLAAGCEYYEALILIQDPIQRQIVREKMNQLPVGEGELLQCTN